MSETQDLIEGEWGYFLTKKELEILWQFLAHQYISYENIELLTLVRRLGKTVDELADATSRTT